ncbi:MAG: 50S ribosomal protein L18 [Thermodesulfovibrionales bacterium]|nr:50S ribosomal protein L18 [Thermodesulfovibrionales bacterium]
MKDKKIAQQRRHERIRKKINGTEVRPRVSVCKSLKHIHVQIINDEKGHTLVSASTLSKEFSNITTNKSNIKTAIEIGKIIAEKAQQKGIKKVVFDRGGYKYHGCIKALADSMRENGLEF